MTVERTRNVEAFVYDTASVTPTPPGDATQIVQAKVVEINGLKAGFQDIRETHLKGSSDWRAWASIVGSTSIPKGKRNQMLNYVGKASRMNSIVSAAVQKS